MRLMDGTETFYIGKRKFNVNVWTCHSYTNPTFQTVTIMEERRLDGIAWTGNKTWFRNVSKAMKQEAIKQYQLISQFDNSLKS